MQADYLLDYDIVSVEREQHLFLLARIKAKADPNRSQRPSLNLSLVIDRSGSMGGDKLANVQKAAEFLVRHLGADDLLSVVSYNDKVNVDLPPSSVIHKDAINKTIRDIRAAGTTNLSGGWLQGCQLVAEKKVDGQVNRVLLLTDGLANQGVTEPVRLAQMARQKRAEGVTTTTMGVGMGFNEDLLVKMAHEGGGGFYFIDDPDQAPAIFAEELQDLLNVMGQNLIVTLSLEPGVRLIRQLNTYPDETKGDSSSFRLGDLYADEVKTLLIELFLPAFKQSGEMQIATLRFEYDELGTDSVTHRSVEVPIMINAVSRGLEDQKPDEEVVKAALLLKAARAREDALKKADEGDFKEAQSILSKVADEIQSTSIKDDDLNTEHNMLREEAVDMEFGQQRYDSHTRKSSTTKIFYSTSSRHGATSQTQSGMHSRLKGSRKALERDGGDTPTKIMWLSESLLLADQALLRIGYENDNDIVIFEEEVTKYHCQIVRRGDNFFLEDLNSTNGTFANGGRVNAPFRLSVGDVVSVGSWLFMFR